MISTPDTIKAALAAYQGHLNTGELTTIEGALTAAIEAAAPIIQAQTLKDAVSDFESNVGVGEFDEQTRRDGCHHTYAYEAWDHQSAYMDWLLNRADNITTGAAFLAAAIADPEGQRLATAAANLATTWSKEWGVRWAGNNRDKQVSKQESEAAAKQLVNEQDLPHMWETVSRTVGPWKEERP